VGGENRSKFRGCRGSRKANVRRRSIAKCKEENFIGIMGLGDKWEAQ